MVSNNKGQKKEGQNVYATSKKLWGLSISIIPSMKSCVWRLNETYQFQFFWNTEQPNFTSLSIAFKRDLVVTVCHPQLEILTALVAWSTVAMLWPCRKTFEQFVLLLNSTRVFDELQSTLFEIALFICCSILRMKVKRIRVNKVWNLSHPYIIAKNAHYGWDSGHFVNWLRFSVGCIIWGNIQRHTLK